MTDRLGCIAVLNAGSSSIKFALYETGRGESKQDGALLFRGQIENIGQAAHLEVADAAGAVVAQRKWTAGALDHDGAGAGGSCFAGSAFLLHAAVARTRTAAVDRVRMGGGYDFQPVLTMLC